MNIINNASIVCCVKNIAGPFLLQLSYCSHPMLQSFKAKFTTGPDNDIFLSIKKPILCPYEQLSHAWIGKGFS